MPAFNTIHLIILKVTNVILDTLSITDTALTQMLASINGMHEILNRTKNRLIQYRSSF